MANGCGAFAVMARQEEVSFLCDTQLFFIIVAMLENRNFFEDRQAESGALCVGAVLVLAHPIFCAEFIFGSCVFETHIHQYCRPERSNAESKDLIRWGLLTAEMFLFLKLLLCPAGISANTR